MEVRKIDFNLIFQSGNKLYQGIGLVFGIYCFIYGIMYFDKVLILGGLGMIIIDGYLFFYE